MRRWGAEFVVGCGLLCLCAAGIVAANVSVADTVPPDPVEEKLAEAQALMTAGQYDAALKLLRTPPVSTSNAARVDRVVQKIAALSVADDFAHVRVLAHAGLEADALVALKAALAKHPGVAPPKDLEHLIGGGIEHWRDARKWLLRYALPLAQMLATVVLALMILYLLWRWLLAKPLLRIDDFTSAGIGSKAGPDIAALIKVAYQGFARGNPGMAIRGAGQVEGLSLPGSIADALPTSLQNSLIQAIPALIDKFLPRRSFHITGHLLDSDAKGAGLMVLATGRSGRSDSVTLWEAEFTADKKPRPGAKPGAGVDQAGDFELLAEIAAIWLLCSLTDLRSRSAGIGSLRKSRLRKVLGTSSWRAFALFRAAVAEHSADRWANARHLYAAALYDDGALLIAKNQLARIALHEKNYAIARELLEQCVEEGASRRPFFSYPHEQSHYAALYMLAVREHADVASDADAAACAAADEKAYERAQRLVDAIRTRRRELLILPWVIVPLSLGLLTGYRHDLRRYLDRLTPLANAMLGSLKISVGGYRAITENSASGRALYAEGGRMLDEIRAHGHARSRISYNMACAFSERARHAVALETKAVSADYLNISLGYLRQCAWLEKTVVSQAKDDRTLHYLKAQLPAKFDAVLNVTPPAPAPPKSDLASLRTIGVKYATQLAAAGFASVADLLKATRTPQQREALADKLNIGTGLVAEWALAMELASLRGLRLEDVNLLMVAGIANLSDLKAMDPAPLLLRLRDWAKTVGASTEPKFSDVELWIGEARQTTPFIQS